MYVFLKSDTYRHPSINTWEAHKEEHESVAVRLRKRTWFRGCSQMKDLVVSLSHTCTYMKPERDPWDLPCRTAF